MQHPSGSRGLSRAEGTIPGQWQGRSALGSPGNAAPQRQRPPRRGARRAGHTGRGHYLSEHLAAAVALPRRGVGYNPGDLGRGVAVLLQRLLRLFPARFAAGRSARRRLAVLGTTAARWVGDSPQQLHHRAPPAPSCLPCSVSPYSAAFPTRSAHTAERCPGSPFIKRWRLRPSAEGRCPPGLRSARLGPSPGGPEESRAAPGWPVLPSLQREPSGAAGRAGAEPLSCPLAAAEAAVAAAVPCGSSTKRASASDVFASLAGW